MSYSELEKARVLALGEALQEVEAIPRIASVHGWRTAVAAAAARIRSLADAEPAPASPDPRDERRAEVVKRMASLEVAVAAAVQGGWWTKEGTRTAHAEAVHQARAALLAVAAPSPAPRIDPTLAVPALGCRECEAEHAVTGNLRIPESHHGHAHRDHQTTPADLLAPSPAPEPAHAKPRVGYCEVCRERSPHLDKMPTGEWVCPCCHKGCEACNGGKPRWPTDHPRAPAPSPAKGQP